MMCLTWQQCPCTQDLTVATTRVGGMMRSGSAAVARVTSAWYSDDQNSAVPGVGQLYNNDINDNNIHSIQRRSLIASSLCPCLSINIFIFIDRCLFSRCCEYRFIYSK